MWVIQNDMKVAATRGQQNYVHTAWNSPLFLSISIPIRSRWPAAVFSTMSTIRTTPKWPNIWASACRRPPARDPHHHRPAFPMTAATITAQTIPTVSGANPRRLSLNSINGDCNVLTLIRACPPNRSRNAMRFECHSVGHRMIYYCRRHRSHDG